MNLPDHLLQTGIDQLPLDYKWDVSIGNKFQGARSESKPKLAEAIRAISTKASYGLVIAATEWVAVRLSRHIDVSDSLQRIEASWAAMIDARYANLPEPDEPDVDARFVLTGPLWTSAAMMGDCFEYGIVPDDNTIFFDTSIGVCMLVEHVCGRSPAFKAWLPETLRRLQQQHPDVALPVSAQPPAGVDFFRPAGAGSFIATLSPQRNPYLRSAAELQADGKANPYPGSS
jgi:hypothetical protein